MDSVWLSDARWGQMLANCELNRDGLCLSFVETFHTNSMKSLIGGLITRVLNGLMVWEIHSSMIVLNHQA